MAGRAKTTGLIRTRDDIDRGIRALRRKCPHIRHMHDTVGAPSLRRSPRGFPGLIRIIVGQQVSSASAAAIWARVQAGLQPMQPQRLLEVNDQEMAALGLSRPKIRSLRALASALATGELNLGPRHLTLSDDDLRNALMQISGIGPWSADVYLLFCLARQDAFAPGDLALQIAVQNLLDLADRPTPDQLLEISERWQPWRGVAARLIWRYYDQQRKSRQLLKSKPPATT